MADQRCHPLTKVLVEFCEEKQKPLCSLIRFDDYQSIIHFHTIFLEEMTHDLFEFNCERFEEAKDTFIYTLQSAPEEKRLVLLTLFFALFLHEVSIPRSPMRIIIRSEETMTYLQDLLEDPDIQPYSLNKEYTALILKSLYIEQVFLNQEDTEDAQDEFLLKLECTMNRAYRLHWSSIRERMNLVKEELMAAAWHPRRVERWLEQGGWDSIEAM
jgi:hypothetical protein